jgi:1,4-alpha-glucan branching enzyme
MARATASKRTKPRKPASDKKRVRFEIQAEKGSDVYVAGTFNEWNPRQHKLTCRKGVYSTSIVLARGKHEYKFVVNGVWCVDPECSEWTPNGLGSLNSVLVVN